MKRFLITVLALAFAALPAIAQHAGAVKVASDTTRVSLDKDMVRDLGSEDDILTLSFRNNTHWFVDALAGGGFYCAEQNRFSQSFITRTRPQAMIGVGKWFHPALAFRLSASVGSFTADYLPIRVWNMYEPVDHNKIPEEALPYYVTPEDRPSIVKASREEALDFMMHQIFIPGSVSGQVATFRLLERLYDRVPFYHLATDMSREGVLVSTGCLLADE